MASVTNNHKSPLRLPDGTLLNPGVETNVAKWDEVSKNATVKAWADAGVLSVGKGEEVPAADEKAELQARLDELEVAYDKRWGVEKLRELLAESEE